MMIYAESCGWLVARTNAPGGLESPGTREPEVSAGSSPAGYCWNGNDNSLVVIPTVNAKEFYAQQRAAQAQRDKESTAAADGFFAGMNNMPRVNPCLSTGYAEVWDAAYEAGLLKWIAANMVPEETLALALANIAARQEIERVSAAEARVA